MKRVFLLLVVTSLWSGILSVSAQQSPALTPEAAQAAERMKNAFSSKSPLTRGLRVRGVTPIQTRSGSVIRNRGPVPTLVPASVAAAADVKGSLPQSIPAAPPPAIPKDQVDLVTTTAIEARVDPQQKIAFNDILFDLDSATVRPASQEVLHGIAEALKSMPDRRFLIEGHTCDLGDDNGPAHNIRLSCLRAEAVCAWLVHYGVSPNQVQPMGFGSSEPVQIPDPTLSKAANEPIRAQNRRAAFRLLVN
ncbi:MAG: OmpA family protein [Verrucomicrobiaceae bacterium]